MSRRAKTRERSRWDQGPISTAIDILIDSSAGGLRLDVGHGRRVGHRRRRPTGLFPGRGPLEPRGVPDLQRGRDVCLQVARLEDPFHRARDLQHRPDKPPGCSRPFSRRSPHSGGRWPGNHRSRWARPTRTSRPAAEARDSLCTPLCDRSHAGSHPGGGGCCQRQSDSSRDSRSNRSLRQTRTTDTRGRSRRYTMRNGG